MNPVLCPGRLGYHSMPLLGGLFRANQSMELEDDLHDDDDDYDRTNVFSLQGWT